MKPSNIARSARDFGWDRQFRKDRSNRVAISLEPRRQDQQFAKRRPVFIDTEARAVRGELEENAAGLAEKHRFKTKTIDHRRRLCTAAQDLLSHFQLVRLVVHSPGEMMNRARPPGASRRRR